MSKTKTAKTAAQTIAHAEVRALIASHRLAATSKDVAAMMGAKGVFAYTETVHAQVIALGIDPRPVFAADRNPKVMKRFIQFVNMTAAQTTDEFSKSLDVTSAVIVFALHLSGGSPLTADALHYLGAGLKEGKVSPETRGVSRSKLSRLFGAVGLSTIPTQTSRTVGRNGFLQLIGATQGEPGKQNQNVTLNESHPLIAAFFAAFARARPDQIDAMLTKKSA